MDAQQPTVLSFIKPKPLPLDCIDKNELLSGKRNLKNENMAQPPKSERKTKILRKQIQDTLLAEIFTGKISAGSRLYTQELAERFHVSHTPIRETLITLAAIGVIDLVPNRTAVVRGITPKEVREVLQVRRALECAAVRLACGRITEQMLSEITLKCQELAKAKPSELPQLVETARATDSQLHDLISNSCGNRFLTSELNRLHVLFRAFRDTSWVEHAAHHNFGRITSEANEHLAIIKAMIVRDRAAASKAMSRHLFNGVSNWTSALPRGGIIDGVALGEAPLQRYTDGLDDFCI
jgi:DNA-binding GntR family transcriptional regulator